MTLDHTHDSDAIDAMREALNNTIARNTGILMGDDDAATILNSLASQGMTLTPIDTTGYVPEGETLATTSSTLQTACIDKLTMSNEFIAAALIDKTQPPNIDIHVDLNEIYASPKQHREEALTDLEQRGLIPTRGVSKSE